MPEGESGTSPQISNLDWIYIGQHHWYGCDLGGYYAIKNRSFLFILVLSNRIKMTLKIVPYM